jgi:glutathione S-transferase
MDFAYPLTGLATLGCGLIYSWTGIVVGKARAKFGVPVPATSGPDDFTRVYRAHANTLEQMTLFIPAMWLFALTMNDLWAAILGGVWCISRILYVRGYARAANQRNLGFAIGALTWLACLLGAGFRMIQSLLN